MSSEADLLFWLRSEVVRTGLHPNYPNAIDGLLHRVPYARVCTIAPRHGGSDPAFKQDQQVYNVMIRHKSDILRGDRTDFDKRFRAFKKSVQEKTGRSLEPMDLLIDIPIPMRHNVGVVKIVDIHRDAKPISESSHVWNSIGEDFEELARRVRVFVRPALRSEFEKLDLVPIMRDVF